MPENKDNTIISLDCNIKIGSLKRTLNQFDDDENAIKFFKLFIHDQELLDRVIDCLEIESKIHFNRHDYDDPKWNCRICMFYHSLNFSTEIEKTDFLNTYILKEFRNEMENKYMISGKHFFCECNSNFYRYDSVWCCENISIEIDKKEYLNNLKKKSK